MKDNTTYVWKIVLILLFWFYEKFVANERVLSIFFMLTESFVISSCCISSSSCKNILFLL